MQSKLRRRTLIVKIVILLVLAPLLAGAADRVYSRGMGANGHTGGGVFPIVLASLLAYALIELLFSAAVTRRQSGHWRRFAQQFAQGTVPSCEFPELQPLADAFCRIQRQLEQESNKIVWIMRHIPGGLVTINQQEELTFAVCPAFDDLGIHVGELVGRHISAYHELIGFSREDSPMIHALYSGMKSRRISKVADHYFEAVNTPMVNDAGVIDGAVCLFIDVTERVRQETEMKRLEKLRLVGQLSASLSHEIRNPLTVIRGFLQMYADRSAPEPDPEQFQLLIGEVDRVAQIVQEFLALTHDRGGELRSESLVRIVRQVSPLLTSEASLNGISLHLDLKDTPCIPLSGNDIKQMLLNLYRNAVEACEADGTVQIATGTDQAGRPFLRVQDDGCGMPSQVLEQLGTPFLSTKENGTGLGLPLCLSVAQAHGAELSFGSCPERGTVVTVLFPPPPSVACAGR